MKKKKLMKYVALDMKWKQSKNHLPALSITPLLKVVQVVVVGGVPVTFIQKSITDEV